MTLILLRKYIIVYDNIDQNKLNLLLLLWDILLVFEIIVVTRYIRDY